MDFIVLLSQEPGSTPGSPSGVEVARISAAYRFKSEAPFDPYVELLLGQ
jgi:hypothetical protein